MVSEIISNDLYVLISKCFLMLHLNDKSTPTAKNEGIKDIFNNLEKSTVTSKKIDIWYNQVSDFSIKSFICTSIQTWIHLLDKTPQEYVRSLQLLRTLKYERNHKIESLLYDQDDDLPTIQRKCFNSFQIFLEEKKNYGSNNNSCSLHQNILINKIKLYLIKVLNNKKTPESAYYLAMIFNSDKSADSIWRTQKYLQISVALDSPEGCFQLGNRFYRGSTVLKSYPEALRLYQKSGELGFLDGFYHAGILLERGLGVDVNIELSKKLFFKSISNKYSFGISRLKVLWNRFPETFVMYVTSSDQGIHEFTDYLSLMYYYGILVEEDRDEARSLWIKGYREHANLKFLKRLEDSFLEFPQDLSIYKTKSEQGNHEYSWRLGVFYKEGICSCQQNNAMANKYWYLGSLSNDSKCQESLQGVSKKIQMDIDRDFLEKSQLFNIVNEDDEVQQTKMIFTFLSNSFDYLYENLNLKMESSTQLSQEYLFIRLFKLILSTEKITEKVLLDWYSQYSNQDFINLAHYYWKYLLGAKIETSQFKLKNFLDTITRKQLSLRDTYLQTDPGFKKSNERCKPISESLNQETLARKTQDNPDNLMANSKIKNLIDDFIKEDKKTNSQWSSYYLGLFLSQLSNNNLRYLSLSFFYLFKSSYFNNTESKFNLGIMCCHSKLLEPNIELSRRLFKTSLEEGYKNACFPLGFLYYNQPDSENNDIAYQCWFQGALHGNINCVYILQILSESLNLYKFKEMIQEGNFKLCYEVGIMFKFGISTLKNEPEALSYWFLGLEKDITSCLEPIKIYFQENTSRLKCYKKVSQTGNKEYSRRWNLILKYKIHHQM